MHHSLYLLSVHPDFRASAVLAVRSARRALRGGETTTMSTAFRDANDIVQRVLDGTPALVGRHADALVVQEAYDAHFADAQGVLAAVDPTPEQIIAGEVPAAEEPAAAAPGPPANPGDDGPIPSEAYETAMVLLCAMDGNPFAAWSIAGTLGRTTRSDGFEEVQRAVLRVFPPDVPTRAIIQQITDGQSDG